MTQHGNKHRIQVTLSNRAMQILEECKKRLPGHYDRERSTSLLVEKAILTALTDPREQYVMRIKEIAQEREILEQQIKAIDEKRAQSEIKAAQAERVSSRVQAAKHR